MVRVRIGISAVHATIPVGVALRVSGDGVAVVVLAHQMVVDHLRDRLGRAFVLGLVTDRHRGDVKVSHHQQGLIEAEESLEFVKEHLVLGSGEFKMAIDNVEAAKIAQLHWSHNRATRKDAAAKGSHLATKRDQSTVGLGKLLSDIQLGHRLANSIGNLSGALLKAKHRWGVGIPVQRCLNERNDCISATLSVVQIGQWSLVQSLHIVNVVPVWEGLPVCTDTVLPPHMNLGEDVEGTGQEVDCRRILSLQCHHLHMDQMVRDSIEIVGLSPLLLGDPCGKLLYRHAWGNNKITRKQSYCEK